MIKGTKVCHESQEYRTPPQVNGIKNEAELGMNRAIPTKSILRTWTVKALCIARKPPEKASKIAPIPMNGKLI
jgi:hypothetical protein